MPPDEKPTILINPDLLKILNSSALINPFAKEEPAAAVEVAEDPIPPFNPEIKLVVNSALGDEHFGLWSYDEDTNVFTAEVSPLIGSIKLNLSTIALFMHSGTPLSPELSNYIMDYTIKVENCVTCAHFAPSAGMVENGAEQIPNWPFNKNKRNGQCSNPDLVGKGNFDNCDFFPNYSHCMGYTANEWSGILASYVDSVPTMLIERQYYSSRIPKYRIGETIYDTQAEASAAFDTHVKELRDAGSTVTVVDLSAPGRNHLFNSILV